MINQNPLIISRYISIPLIWYQCTCTHSHSGRRLYLNEPNKYLKKRAIYIYIPILSQTHQHLKPNYFCSCLQGRSSPTRRPRAPGCLSTCVCPLVRVSPTADHHHRRRRRRRPAVCLIADNLTHVLHTYTLPSTLDDRAGYDIGRKGSLL